MNEAMGSVVGGLIQMNAKVVMSDTAQFMVVCGAVFGALMLLAVAWAFDEKRRWWVWLVAALLFAGVAYWGTRLPRQKVIHACVDGPVSLELIASRYDILKVDGKELTLRVR